jgi:glycosyltransferase involved in cell wall biosynthesis
MSTSSKEAAEVVLVNDGSTDRSLEIAESIIAALAPLEVSIVTQTNQGSSAARNAGIARCTGEYILLLDADDELSFDPIPWIRQYPDASALIFSVRYAKGGSLQGIRKPPRINKRSALDILTADSAVIISSILSRKDRIRQPFETRLRTLEDWLFWMMNLSVFEHVVTFPEVISSTIHIHGGNKSSDQQSIGKYRKDIADHVLETLADTLTQKQKNNLLIQSQIGLIQQRSRISIRTFLRVPCDLTLYAKLLAYYLGIAITRYD